MAEEKSSASASTADSTVFNEKASSPNPPTDLYNTQGNDFSVKCWAVGDGTDMAEFTIDSELTKTGNEIRIERNFIDKLYFENSFLKKAKRTESDTNTTVCLKKETETGWGTFTIPKDTYQNIGGQETWAEIFFDIDCFWAPCKEIKISAESEAYDRFINQPADANARLTGVSTTYRLSRRSKQLEFGMQEEGFESVAPSASTRLHSGDFDMVKRPKEKEKGYRPPWA